MIEVLTPPLHYSAQFGFGWGSNPSLTPQGRRPHLPTSRTIVENRHRQLTQGGVAIYICDR
jgi:hypothetical protein